jgi:KipI family sensor histidine kinase inhibitor
MINARAAGDAGLLLDTDVPPAQLAAAIERAMLPGVVDVIPAAATVLVLTGQGAADFAQLAATIAALPVMESATGAEAVVEIPVRYDGADLAEVAELAGLSVAEVIAAHTAGLYTVGWLGFSPGFGYLRGLDHRLAGVPRLATPRLAVPAGSVAIAGGLAAVYPRVSPGGWRLLGHTTVRMWDQEREPAALLAPGRHVRFVDVSQPGTSRFIGPTAVEAPPKPLGAVSSAAGGGLNLEVIKPGPLATVQDLGRRGQGAIGVPPSGAADLASLILANRLVGNPEGSAGIELTLGRAVFRCHGDLTVAVTGAPATVTVDQGAGTEPVAFGFGVRIDAAAGSVVGIGAPSTGLRTYLSVAGGVAVPAVLGSRSADLLSGLGGGPLRPGTTLPIGSDSAADNATAIDADAPGTGTRIIERGGVTELRVIGGPRLDWFETGALGRLCSGLYTVTPASNRTGLRLDGEPMHRWSEAELPSEGLVTGALEVPPDGLPILLLADHPTVGGYPVIAVVVSADIGLAAQLRPGDRLRLTRLPASR